MDERKGRPPLGLNESASRIADQIEANAAAHCVSVARLCGARVIDCGIEAAGGYEAGRLLGEICMGGAGRVGFTGLIFDGLNLPGVCVQTDHPALACLASQYAGWAIKPEGYFAMGSGPLRAIARVEKELYEHLGYSESSDGRGVLVLETRTLPTEAVVEYVVAKSGVAAERLTILVAPTATIAAGVQVSARVIETAMHKIHELGFDVGKVVGGFGTAPLPPVAKNDMRAIGRTNDCVLYGGVTHLTVRAEDAELEALVPRIPSSSSRDYGTPFYDLFQRYGGDFYKVDPHLFSPAEVFVTNAKTGRTFRAGAVNPEVLRQSLLS